MYFFNICKTSVFPQLIAVTQLDIGKIPLKVLTEGSLVYSLVVQKTVAPGAVSSVAVAEEYQSGVVCDAYDRG